MAQKTLTVITNFLRYMLPTYTSLFSEEVLIDTVVFNGIHAQITTQTEHGLIEGNYVVIKNVVYLWSITDISYNINTGILTGLLPNNHQILKTDKTINLSGDYVGIATLLSLDNNDLITVCLPKGLTITQLDCYKLLYGYINTSFRVDDVLNNLIFMVLYERDIGQVTYNGSVVTNSRVDAGYNVENYIHSYASKQTSITDFLYIEYDSTEMSRGNNKSDFNRSTQKNTNDWNYYADKYNIYYIANTTNESSKAIFVDRANSEVRAGLFKVLNNNPNFEGDYMLTFDGNEIQEPLGGQTNLSVMQYLFYIKNDASVSGSFDQVEYRRIKDVILDCNFSKKEEC